MIDKINKQIADYFGDINLHAEEYKKSKKSTWYCDLTLVEDWECGRPFTPAQEALRDAVAAYIFHENPDVQRIAYGGVYYSRDSLLVALFKGFGH